MQAKNNCELFGFDLRSPVRYWQQGWQSALWAPGSPLSRHLRSSVSITMPDGSTIQTVGYQAKGEALPAYALPADLILHRQLLLPTNIEGELESMLALEVRANSPFAQNHSHYTWVSQRLNKAQLQVDLFIISHRHALQWLEQHHGITQPDRAELWVLHQSTPILIPGFGEQQRQQQEHTRFKRLGGLATLTLALFWLTLAIPVLASYLQLDKLERWHQQAEQRSATAQQQRSQLIQAREHLTQLEQMLLQRPQPYPTLALLSELLDDDVWIQQYEQRANLITLNGQAPNAAAVHQQLADHPAFAEVRAPSGFRRHQQTGKELFTLEIKVSEEWPA